MPYRHLTRGNNEGRKEGEKRLIFRQFSSYRAKILVKIMENKIVLHG